MRNIQGIYTDNKLVKKIDTPAQYKGIKEILYKYRDIKELWELEKHKTFDWLCENELGTIKIELQYPYIDWARIWRHWSDMKLLRRKSECCVVKFTLATSFAEY